MPKQIYQIRLTPVSTFFFGNERHFSSGEDGVNYLVRSNFLPQQTTLLGLLRFLALEKNGLLSPQPESPNAQDAAHLVGSESFDASKTEQDFGGIHRLSPVFLARRGEVLFPRSAEFLEKQPVGLQMLKGRAFFNQNQQTTEIPRFDSTTEFYKKGFDAAWIAQKTGESFSEKDIFQKDERDGIIKIRDDDDQDAYFKQTMLKMKAGFHFLFFAELDNNCRPDAGLVTLGGEKSTFRLNIEPAPAVNPLADWSAFVGGAYVHPQPTAGRFVLVSPTLLPDGFEKNLSFASGGTMDFRNLRSQLGTTQNFTDVSATGSNVRREQKKYNLLAPGTVLLAKDAQALSTDLIAAKNFQKIGYNYFVEA
jgi:CRISPR-associated protein Cmr3